MFFQNQWNKNHEFEFVSVEKNPSWKNEIKIKSLPMSWCLPMKIHCDSITDIDIGAAAPDSSQNNNKKAPPTNQPTVGEEKGEEKKKPIYPFV